MINCFALFWKVEDYQEVTESLCLAVYSLEVLGDHVIEIRRGDFLFSFVITKDEGQIYGEAHHFITDNPFCIRTDNEDKLRCFLRKNLWEKWNIPYDINNE